MSTPIVYLNGQFLPKDQVRISPDDRGFLLGDGIYEVTRTYDGRLFLPREHLDRMRYSLCEVQINLPDLDQMESVWHELLQRNNYGKDNAIVYVQVTRGAAPRTHAFPNPPVPPTVYAYAAPVKVKFDPQVGVGAITVPDQRWARCDIKSVSLLANCIANTQAQERGAFEAIFVRDGVALEGSHTSLFAVIDGEVRTAPKNNYVLPGITRGLVVDLCHEAGIPLRETPVFLPQL